MDPPQNYGEKVRSKGPVIQIRPYQEVTTSNKWVTDAKTLGRGVQVAVNAQEAHVQGSAMLRAQCRDKLCDFGND